MLDHTSLKVPKDHGDPESAMEILMDQDNRELPIFAEKSELFHEETWDGPHPVPRKVLKRITKYYRLQDRVEHIYNILEKLIDHQADVERRSGVAINIRPRRRLEGWDFKDLTSDGDPFFPRVATLEAMGKGWVDFSRQIHAITLFGRGFQRLLEPAATISGMCPAWMRLPTQRYYLAAQLSDLKDIMADYGDEASNPKTLCEGMIWPVNRDAFQPCFCTVSKERKRHHDPVQDLFPSRFAARLGSSQGSDLNPRGAVVFGHNMNTRWHWGDTGDPELATPSKTADEIKIRHSKSFSRDDSGLGSSISSSTGQMDTSTSRTPSPANPQLQQPGWSDASACEPVTGDRGKESTGPCTLHVLPESTSRTRKLKVASWVSSAAGIASWGKSRFSNRT